MGYGTTSDEEDKWIKGMNVQDWSGSYRRVYDLSLNDEVTDINRIFYIRYPTKIIWSVDRCLRPKVSSHVYFITGRSDFINRNVEILIWRREIALESSRNLTESSGNLT